MLTGTPKGSYDPGSLFLLPQQHKGNLQQWQKLHKAPSATQRFKQVFNSAEGLLQILVLVRADEISSFPNPKDQGTVF